MAGGVGPSATPAGLLIFFQPLSMNCTFFP